MTEFEGVEEGLGGEGRSVVYCLVPFELAEKLHELLRGHFAEDDGVEVIVERRRAERRAAGERRAGGGEPPAAGERRRVRRPGGRRIGERRATLAELKQAPSLPRRARRYAKQIRFVEGRRPSTQEVEDRDTARLVARFQAGDAEAFGAIYSRYFDRVYGYLRLALADHHEAEDLTQEAFTRLFERAGEYERRRQPFRAWLFVVVRNLAIDCLRRRHALVVEDIDEVNRRREQSEPGDPELEAMNWISDRDLLLFLDRLPEPQRQALLLRFTLDLSTEQIAHIMGRTHDDVRMLQSRGLAFLRDRLTAIGRAPTKTERSRSQRKRPQLTVIRSRRWSL